LSCRVVFTVDATMNEGKKSEYTCFMNEEEAKQAVQRCILGLVREAALHFSKIKPQGRNVVESLVLVSLMNMKVTVRQPVSEGGSRGRLPKM